MKDKQRGIEIFGWDVGKRQDPSSLILANRTERNGQGHYHVNYAKQWGAATPYPEQAAAVRAIVTDPSIDQSAVSLVIDITGVGEGVADMVCAGLDIPVYRVWITGGTKWRRDEENGSYNVAKGLLVSAIKALFGQQRLEIVQELVHASTLNKELDNFEVKISKAANELYSAREGKHDDLILAVAIAVFAGENLCLGPWDATVPEGARSIVDRAPPGLWLNDGRRDEDDITPPGGRRLWQAPRTTE